MNTQSLSLIPPPTNTCRVKMSVRTIVQSLRYTSLAGLRKEPPQISQIRYNCEHGLIIPLFFLRSFINHDLANLVLILDGINQNMFRKHTGKKIFSVKKIQFVTVFI